MVQRDYLESCFRLSLVSLLSEPPKIWTMLFYKIPSYLSLRSVPLTPYKISSFLQDLYTNHIIFVAKIRPLSFSFDLFIVTDETIKTIKKTDFNFLVCKGIFKYRRIHVLSKLRQWNIDFEFSQNPHGFYKPNNFMVN